MSQTLSGRYYIDGMDLWTVFSIIVEDGSSGFLQYAPKKESITHDWQDSHGLDVDLSQYFFEARDIPLRCAILADGEEDFWTKYQAFIQLLMQPGTRRITVGEFGERSFNVFYRECNGWDRFTRIKDKLVGERVACKFTIIFTENEPAVNNDHVFIIDEDGRFLIT